MTIHAELETIRERVEGATEGPWTWSAEEDGWGDCGPNLEGAVQVIGSWGHDANGIFVDTADAEFIAHARTDLPKLLDAVEKVLELHKPWQSAAGGTIWCDECMNDSDHPDNEYPCRTVRAITTALEGK